uniref:Uncharacterized protein n=1 Tax=Picea glauca TaxID=3330 RepID=A0A101LY29_PICGL|nr:hypothetical protein ABT39_MTgene5631 [Picea glauca]
MVNSVQKGGLLEVACNLYTSDGFVKMGNSLVQRWRMGMDDRERMRAWPIELSSVHLAFL